MAKTIVFCADGTWNGPEDQSGQSATEGDDNAGELSGDTITNVVKLYANLAGRPTPETLALRNEQEKELLDAAGNTLQVAKYLHGVGDSRNPVIKVLGGVFGAGLISRIVRGYTYISRHYQAGDAICIVGFSRGAYTARALAGMIARVGLLNPAKYDVNDKEAAYRRGVAAWHRSKGITLTGNSQATKLGNRLLDFIESFVAHDALASEDLIANLPIKAVGVWDTVGSLGIPLYLRDGRFDVFGFTDSKLSELVELGFHAMAVDELRADFPVTPWERRKGVEQVWFAGAHADVGGGYPQAESRLSDVTLQWMMKKLSDANVKFATPLTRIPNCECSAQQIHTPWTQSPFDRLNKTSRKPKIEDVFDANLIARWQSDASYRPTALSFITQENFAKLSVQP
jgi:uncharacterized protein (DUF2235 family)